MKNRTLRGHSSLSITAFTAMFLMAVFTLTLFVPCKSPLGGGEGKGNNGGAGEEEAATGHSESII